MNSKTIDLSQYQIKQLNFNYTTVPNDINRSSVLNVYEFRVFFYLQSFNPCYPSQKQIVKDTGISESTLRRTLHRLIDKGWLTKKKGKKIHYHDTYYLGTQSVRETAQVHNNDAIDRSERPVRPVRETGLYKKNNYKKNNIKRDIVEQFNPTHWVKPINESTGQASGDPPTKNLNKSKPKAINREHQELIHRVIDYLNEKAKRSYAHTSIEATKHILARIKEKYSYSDFKAVIDTKVKQWSQDENMRPYLRPKTLFNKSNMETYVQEIKDGMHQEEDNLSIIDKINPEGM